MFCTLFANFLSVYSVLQVSSNNFTALLYPLYPYNVILLVVGTSLINLTCPSFTSRTLQFKLSCVNVDVVFSFEPEYVPNSCKIESVLAFSGVYLT